MARLVRRYSRSFAAIELNASAIWRSSSRDCTCTTRSRFPCSTSLHGPSQRSDGRKDRAGHYREKSISDGIPAPARRTISRLVLSAISLARPSMGSYCSMFSRTIAWAASFNVGRRAGERVEAVLTVRRWTGRPRAREAGSPGIRPVADHCVVSSAGQAFFARKGDIAILLIEVLFEQCRSLRPRDRGCAAFRGLVVARSTSR